MATPSLQEILRQGGGNPVVIDGVLYQPIYETSGQGETAERGPLLEVFAYDPNKTAPGQEYIRFTPDMEKKGTASFQEVKGISDMLGQTVQDFTPLVLAALGANALGAAFGQESIFGGMLTGGSEAAGSLTSGITPEAIAASEAGLPTVTSGISSAPLSTTVGSPLAELTGEAAVAGTETAPYVMSSADKAALYGSEAAYGPGMTGTQTAAYDAVLNATGSKDLANIAANVAGTVSPSTLSKLIPSLITAAVTPGLFTSNQGTPGNLTTPSQGVPTSSPEYYKAVQQYYNAYMPNAPRDVSGPLQQWYDNSYGTSTTGQSGSPGQPNVSIPGRPTMRPMSAGAAQEQRFNPAQDPTQDPNQILFNEYMRGYQDTGGYDERNKQVLTSLFRQNPELFAAFTADPTLYNAAYGGQYSSISPERQEAKQRAEPKREQAFALQRILARNSDVNFEDPAAVANAFSDLGQQAQLYLATGRSPESAGLLRSYAQPLRGAALAGDLAAGRLNYDQAMDISRYQDAQQGLEQARSQLAAYNASVQAGQRPEQAGYAENLQRIINMNEGQIQKYAPTFTGVDMAALDYNRLNTPQDIIDFAQRAGVGTQASSLFAPTGG